jgi:hypothetical protein
MLFSGPENRRGQFMKTRLSDDEKRAFYKDGFFVLRELIPEELVTAAQARYRSARPGEDLTHAPEFTDLVNKSPLTPIMRELMGEFDPPSATRHIVRPKNQKPGDHFVALGYRDKDLPYYGTDLHMDGQAVFRTPQEPAVGTPEEIYKQYISTGRKGDIGRCADNIGVNYAPLFHDPGMTNSLGGFTAFLFVCLSDQTMPGGGQTNVLRGGHHAAERFFRWQHSVNGCLGPEGPGWPRLNHDVPNRCGYRHLPDRMYEEFINETAECTPDGRRWPRPTPVFMSPGDATIAMYHIPHGGSRNENGNSARKSPIFALVNKKRQPNKVMAGNSDHPDRAWDGSFLEFEEGNDPYERSRYALCNMYHEWDGMTEIVAQERAKERDSESAPAQRQGSAG